MLPEQMAILDQYGVSLPQDIPNPVDRLRFVNAFSEDEICSGSDKVAKCRHLPNDADGVALDGEAIFEAGLSPAFRLELQYRFDAVAAEREARAQGLPVTMSDDEYHSEWSALQPYCTKYTREVVDRIRAFYLRRSA